MPWKTFKHYHNFNWLIQFDFFTFEECVWGNSKQYTSPSRFRSNKILIRSVTDPPVLEHRRLHSSTTVSDLGRFLRSQLDHIAQSISQFLLQAPEIITKTNLISLQPNLSFLFIFLGLIFGKLRYSLAFSDIAHYRLHNHIMSPEVSLLDLVID